MSRRFARAGGPTGSEAYGPGTNIVASATPHAVGSWVEIDASVAEDCCGIWMASDTIIGVSATNTSMLVELAFGAAAAEITQVQWFAGAAGVGIATYLPLHIPKGTKLSGRIQGAVASDIYTPLVVLEYCTGRYGFGGFSEATAIGLNAATSAPTTGDLADNAWDECIASTAEPYRAFTVHLGVNGASSGLNNFRVDLGVGAAGSEQVLGTWSCGITSQETKIYDHGPRFVEQPVAAGQRMSLRKNSTSDLTGHIIGWR